MSTIALLLHETKSLENSSSMHSFITNFRSIEQFSYDLEKWFRLSVRYLFYQRSKHGLFVFPNACGEGTVRLANRISVWRQSEVSVDFRKVLRGMKFFYPSIRLTNQKPRAFVSFRRSNQIGLSPFVCCFFFFSRVFISRSYENRSQKTVNVYTADVTHLKGRRLAICYLFEREKQSPRINWFPKIMVRISFNFFRLYDIFRHWKRFLLLLQRVGKDEPTFSSFSVIHA